MDLISHTILLVSAVCFTLGFINLRLWVGNRDRNDLLAMAAVCFFGGAYSMFEVGWLKSVSPYEFGEIARWSQVASWGTVVSLSTFLRLHLRSGRTWLLWSLFGVRTFGMCINFAMPVNIQFRELTAIGQVTVLGEQLSYPIGIPNPWHLVQILSFVLLFAFALDSSITVWRGGERRKAVIFGGGVALVCIATLAIAGAVIWFSAKFPAFASPTILFVVLGMAFEFDYDLRRSVRLAGELTSRKLELTETLEQLNLSANAARVGIWARDLGTGAIWANKKLCELLDLDDSHPITGERYLERVLQEDRERLQKALTSAVESEGAYEIEYRVQLRNGDIRWIKSMGQIQTLDTGEKLLRGASVDITRRKLAEEDAHELSGKLIDAQEKERARLARELHDDLSQSLALLSIQLQSLVTKPGEPREINKQVDKLTQQIQELSSEVHRISHELHPSKLNQLGLEAALRGFCRETHSAHGLKIGFTVTNVPRSLPPDISLCLYRIAQEALQNIVKHSGAGMANVELRTDDGTIKLTISDNGSGFDTNAVRSKESLGLISMQERIRSVDGTLTIESVRDAGTKIEASAPL